MRYVKSRIHKTVYMRVYIQVYIGVYIRVCIPKSVYAGVYMQECTHMYTSQDIDDSIRQRTRQPKGVRQPQHTGLPAQVRVL